MAGGDANGTASALAAFDAEDIAALAEILELEKRSHTRRLSLCFWMFLISLIFLVLGLFLAVARIVQLMMADTSGADLGQETWMWQPLATLATFALACFSAWWGVQNCLHAIDRTLFAARSNRHVLFVRFLDQIPCADNKKKGKWVEVVKSIFI